MQAIPKTIRNILFSTNFSEQTKGLSEVQVIEPPSGPLRRDRLTDIIYAGCGRLRRCARGVGVILTSQESLDIL